MSNTIFIKSKAAIYLNPIKLLFAFSLALMNIIGFNLYAAESPSAIQFDFNAMPAHHLTDKIDMRFITSPQFTVIQWNLMAGAKLPVHSHLNEQVIRVLKGDLEIHTGTEIYAIHEGDVIVFPPYVTHGFIALTDTIMYEQQTPIRQDFLQEGFIEKLSDYLKQNQ
ncbi:cupin domain-containing protein [Fluoribacter gormanii]|uniref:cupin domain-containing protein n=1 Tax=Fluoribacter gormanii TaxID=464 RepID=UPI00224346CD|nr:cupin domain-containing protein [Fluoribacter gormanii]MCW8442874.1 cupin domain-containing protein [Fluoribacter gormanii]